MTAPQPLPADRPPRGKPQVLRRITSVHGTAAIAEGRSSRPSRHRRLPAEPAVIRRRRIEVRATAAVVAGDLLAVLTAAVAIGGMDLTAVVTAALLVGLCVAGGFHRLRFSLSVLDDGPSLAARLLVATAVAGLLAGFGAPVPLDPLRNMARLAVALPILLMLRAATYAVVRHGRRSHVLAQPLLIIGAGHIGFQLATITRAHGELGLDPRGFYDPRPRTDGPHEAGDLPIFDNLAEALRATRATVAIVAFSSLREDRLVEVLRACDRLDVEIYQVPRLFELSTGASRSVDDLWGLPVVRFNRAAHRSISWRLKRALDVIVAVGGLAVASPVMALCALAVRFDGGPGVIFRQERVGLDGRRFEILKFRSMRPATTTESATNWNIANDDRLRTVGKLLRKTSLDELPQLWNVLRGDMSLVGPRPERPHFVGRFGERYTSYGSRHRVPSGLTGWAQIHGLRGDTSIEDRARFDNFYIEHWSLWTDCKIMLRTVAALVTKRGA